MKPASLKTIAGATAGLALTGLLHQAQPRRNLTVPGASSGSAYSGSLVPAGEHDRSVVSSNYAGGPVWSPPGGLSTSNIFGHNAAEPNRGAEDNMGNNVNNNGGNISRDNAGYNADDNSPASSVPMGADASTHMARRRMRKRARDRADAERAAAAAQQAAKAEADSKKELGGGRRRTKKHRKSKRQLRRTRK